MLKICLTDPDSLSLDDYPNFKIILDEKDEILLEFDTHEGRRKAALSLLLAILLKDITKTIKIKTGEKPA